MVSWEKMVGWEKLRSWTWLICAKRQTIPFWKIGRFWILFPASFSSNSMLLHAVKWVTTFHSIHENLVNNSKICLTIVLHLLSCPLNLLSAPNGPDGEKQGEPPKTSFTEDTPPLLWGYTEPPKPVLHSYQLFTSMKGITMVKTIQTSIHLT